MKSLACVLSLALILTLCAAQTCNYDIETLYYGACVKNDCLNT
jgi:hypothetical protein